jgi:hypothetical protein
MRHNLLPLLLNDVKLNCSILRLNYVYVPLGENARAPYDSYQLLAIFHPGAAAVFFPPSF